MDRRIGRRGEQVGATRSGVRPVLAVLAAAMVAIAGSSCAPEPDAPPPADWVTGAAAVRPSVHSIWASRPALEGLTAFAPVGTGFTVAVDSIGASVLTNAHVVADTAGEPLRRLSVLVQTDTGSILFLPEVVALDRQRDLALLRIGDTTAVPVQWRTDRVPMGTPVATIGYGLPEGGIVDTADARVTTRYTVARRFTAGYASAYRTLTPGDPSTNVLELDLFLFPGVSGGPMFTRDGRVLGVNRGGWELRAETTSYGHAIPVLVVRQFLRAAGHEDAVFGAPAPQ